MSGNTAKLKIPIVVVNPERSKRKTYLTYPCLKEALEKANKYGCPGTKIFHDGDGSEICDNEIFEYLLRRDAYFMICNNYCDWTPHDRTPISNVLPSKEPFFTKSRVFSDEEEQMYPELRNYSISWEKLEPDIVEKLETERQIFREVRTLANFLIGDLRTVKPTLTMPIMRSLSFYVVSEYPKSFCKSDMDYGITELTEYLLNVLKNRYYNQTRMRSKKNKRMSLNKGKFELNARSVNRSYIEPLSSDD